jgi:hypothetical protein
MSLEFRPAPVQPRPTMADYAQQWGKSLGDIGDTFAQAAAQRRQRNLAAITAAIQARNNGMDPNAIYTQMTGNAPPMVPGTQAPMPQNPGLMPNFQPSPGQGQMASAGMPDTGYGEARTSPQVSSLVDRSPWKNMNMNPQPQPQATPPRSIFDSSPVNYATVINDIKNGQYDSFYRLPEKEKDNLKELPAFKALTKDQSGTNYSADDITDAEKGNWQAIAGRNGGKIPSSLATLGESATSKADAAYEKKRLDAQNAMITVRGDQSIARTEGQRDAAALAYNTIERVKNEGRMPTKLEYYDLLGQMWKARTSASPTDQALKDLDQKTFQGDLGKAYTYFTGKTAGATTQDVLQNLQNFVAESGIQAEKQHEAYMAARQSKVLNGLKPEDQQSLMNVHRGMSFQDQTGYKPKAIYATNGKQRIMSIDNGQTWRPAQ